MNDTATNLQAKQDLVKHLDVSAELHVFWYLTQDSKMPAAPEGSSGDSGHSERSLSEEDIYVGKESQTWKSTVFSGFVFVILQKIQSN